MTQTLYLIRGLPGSGKLALSDLISNATNAVQIELEQFFTTTNGHEERYKFDRRFLGAAHDECYGRTIRYLREGKSVIVTNTFSTNREVNRYLTGVKRTGLEDTVTIKIIKCVGKYKSRHNIPSRAIEKMRTRWEDVTNEVTFNGVF